MGRLSRALHAEDGFTLVEMVAAVTIASIILIGGAGVLGGSLKAIVAARANSQAAELMSEQLEKLRAYDYSAVAMSPTDLSGDANITGVSPSQMFDPDGTGPLVAEAIVAASGGVVTPHIVTITRNSQAYTVRTYVTTPPADCQPNCATYKRITVRATWSSGGLSHTRQSSTYITQTRRGLPLPNFQLLNTSSTSPIAVNAGAQLVLPFSIVNRGARDTFNLSIAAQPTLGATFTFYKDTTGNRTYESGSDTAASDTDLNGAKDTGQLATDATVPMLAVVTVPSETAAGSYLLTLTATSSGQPTATGATRTTDFDVTVSNDSACSGCTYTAMYLLNQYPACSTAPCNTTAQANMPLQPGSAPTAATEPNFDTDVDSGPGRAVAKALLTPAFDSTTTSTMATWRYTVPQNTTLKGGADVVIDLYAAATGSGITPGTGVVTLKAYLNQSTSTSGTLANIASGTATVTSTGDFVHVRIRVTVPSNTTISRNRFIGVKVVVDSASTTGAWLAYDAYAYPSVAWIPVV
jgi:prepilin-type N-terminal cleavage/methylation domain-containing protein